MGLDMYLYGVKQEFHKHDYNIGGYKESTEIGYWRKANQIHKWFVDNVQDGVDNCATYYVDVEQLKELKSICEAILNDHSLAEELLPTSEGFFFGGTEYDDFYFNDLKDTIDIINYCLDLEYDYFEYSSSW